MTSFPDDDSEKLIELIRQHPPIYDVQLESYRDEHLKDNIWKIIAETINKSDSECRKKWKLIRDSYNRYKRKQKHSTGSAAPAKNSKWQFYERLRFLENTPSERRSSTSIIEQDTNTSSEVGYKDTPPEVTDELAHDNEYHVLTSELVEPIPETSTSTPERSIPQKISKNSEKSTKKNIKRKREDDDFIKFLKQRHENRNSYLEALKSQQTGDDISTFTKHIEMMLRKLSARSRVMAKNEIFSIVSKYEIGDIDGQSSSYNSCSPISEISSEHKTQSDLIDLSCRQLQNISSEPFQNILSDEFDQNDLTNLP